MILLFSVQKSQNSIKEKNSITAKYHGENDVKDLLV